ncbi:hypothetical protein [Bacteroides thetaiotaomicron]|uniref:hypothetical protein n=1 Tax=Bacteroides thetaiotaomicron TaxID=818 RepID=UPI001F29B2DD|nr:hypothetical protein [Bacteroides thetaiotaomicron]MCE8949314.1 hypothetical protein [Bacteroides thetaiotaomicron]MCE8967552.1 hypothetical protein [Bacteroides thetaiotaomicron]
MKTLIESLRLVFMFALSLLIGFSVGSCSNTDELEELNNTIELKTRAIPTLSFDWENADWMPTPSMQSRISVPWTGQGSLAGTYGLDIVNDRRAFDGWELLYNTFDSNATAPLVNPYFVLYNKYRGIMRIYLYLTTSFVTTSSYIQDGLTIISNRQTSILNYLGQEIIDIDKESNKQYMQMQPAPIDGSLPLAANRWYMMQYEMAYDPNLANLPFKDIQFSWTLNYYNVQQIKLGGKMVGSLNGTIGSASSPSFFTSLVGAGKTVGTGVLAGLGKDLISKNTINAETGENKLGLPNSTFKDVAKGVSTALSVASGNWAGAVVKLLSAIAGGSSSAPTPISMTLKASIEMNGTGTEGGAFPSTPVSFWIPGTNITSEASGFIPLYNKSLGVLYLREKPKLVIDTYSEDEFYEIDPQYGHDIVVGYDYSCYLPTNFDFTSYLAINPEVEKLANVEILKQELVSDGELGRSWQHCGYQAPTGSGHGGPYLNSLAVRFTIKISPKNGASSSIIIKTFEITPEFINWHY